MSHRSVGIDREGIRMQVLNVLFFAKLNGTFTFSKRLTDVSTDVVFKLIDEQHHQRVLTFPRMSETSCASSTESFMPSYDSSVGTTFDGVMKPMNLSDSLIVSVFR